MTSLNYGTPGTLTYGYDADNRRTSVGGSLASVPTPQPTQSFTYNPDNSLKTVGSSAVTNVEVLPKRLAKYGLTSTKRPGWSIFGDRMIERRPRLGTCMLGLGPAPSTF
ncbi:MAG TPA: hypothetical protein VKB84_01775 [Candidatus Binataceae bacterium]|nr:hypothetical protein [Candidatus Binataceae bacterium]